MICDFLFNVTAEKRMLNEDDKEFIKLKYKQELSVEQIADELAGYKKREKIVKDIIYWSEVIIVV